MSRRLLHNLQRGTLLFNYRRSKMEPQMIIRANLGAPDLLLDGSPPLQDSLGKPLICKNTKFYLRVKYTHTVTNN